MKKVLIILLGLVVLAVCFWLYLYVFDTKSKASQYLKSAENGDSSAQRNLGWCYANGEGVKKDQAEAVKWWRKSAEQGLATAQNNLGWCYADGEGVEKNQVEAVKWYRKSAEQGHKNAQYKLGMCYYNGRDMTKNESEADWLRKASEQGQEAVKWFKMAAKQGHMGALVKLGLCYRDGIGVSKDEDRAFELFRDASDKSPEAMYNWGLCYRDGIGVSKNEYKALQRFTNAAKWGHAESQMLLNSLPKKRIIEERDITYSGVITIFIYLFIILGPLFAFIDILSSLAKKSLYKLQLTTLFCGSSWLGFLITFFSSGLSGPYTIYYLIPPLVFFVVLTCSYFYNPISSKTGNMVVIANGLLMIFLYYIAINSLHINIDIDHPGHILVIILVIISLIWIQTIFYNWFDTLKNIAPLKWLKRVNNRESLGHVPCKLITCKICFEVVKHNGSELQYVPDHLKDREVCLEAVKQDGSSLRYVPDNLKDREMCMIAVKQDGSSLRYVPNNLKDREMCLIAVKENVDSLQYVPDNLKPEVKATLH